MPAVSAALVIASTSSAALAPLGPRSLHVVPAGLVAAGPGRGGQAPREAA